jgi:hypothetical protein
MRRIITLLAGALLALGLTAGPALAFEPPGNQDPYLFGCDDDGNSHPVLGHPGAVDSDGAGIDHATGLVAGLTGDGQPTAWNAVQHTDQIVAGECPSADEE